MGAPIAKRGDKNGDVPGTEPNGFRRSGFAVEKRFRSSFDEKGPNGCDGIGVGAPLPMADESPGGGNTNGGKSI